MYENHLEKAIDYVREFHSWSEADEAKAFDAIDHLRSSLSLVGKEIYDEIVSLLDEYGVLNQLPDDWWSDITDPEDIFFEL